jgi:hypothetical protein
MEHSLKGYAGSFVLRPPQFNPRERQSTVQKSSFPDFAPQCASATSFINWCPTAMDQNEAIMVASATK